MRDLLNPATRRWIYGISVVAIPLLVTYGALDENVAPLWLAVIGAVLVPGLALANVNPDEPTDDLPEHGDSDA